MTSMCSIGENSTRIATFEVYINRLNPFKARVRDLESQLSTLQATLAA